MVQKNELWANFGTDESRTVITAVDRQHPITSAQLLRRRRFLLNQSLSLFGRKSWAGQEHGDQSERCQSRSHQRTIKKPACCNGEERQRAGQAQREDLQPHGHQLSENRNPVHCGQGADSQEKQARGDWCPRGWVFTQRVDDPHAQLDAEEHEGPACSPQGPGPHTVRLVFFGKNLLQETTQTPVGGRKHSAEVTTFLNQPIRIHSGYKCWPRQWVPPSTGSPECLRTWF